MINPASTDCPSRRQIPLLPNLSTLSLSHKVVRLVHLWQVCRGEKASLRLSV